MSTTQVQRDSTESESEFDYLDGLATDGHDDYDPHAPVAELIAAAVARLILTRDGLEEIRPLSTEAAAGIEGLDDNSTARIVADPDAPDHIRDAVDGIRRALSTMDATLDRWLAIADRIDLAQS